jgi:5-methyltetrahydrofolate--homocysteine methyltransferase
LARKYGAAVVALALDDVGIPKTAGGRVEIVDRIRSAAHDAGLGDSDLVVDVLTMTAATDPDAVSVTLDAVRAVSAERGLATVLGVSNVSHGLPGRAALNAAFLEMAAAEGLDAAIANPADLDVARAVKAADVLLGRDEQAAAWVAWSSAEERLAEAEGRVPSASSLAGGEAGDGGGAPGDGEGPRQGLSEDGGAPPSAPEAALAAAIDRGDKDAAPGLVEDVISAGRAAGEVIAEVLTPAIQRLGDAFGRGEVFLPQLMVSAEAMKAAVEQVKTHLSEEDGHGAGRVVFATVKGDIHSIGKDICVSLLESQGFEVDDLGVDVEAEEVVRAADAAQAVCLSALMTTTLPAMERTVADLTDRSPGIPVFVGGAVVTREWANSIGAGYSDDAPGCVDAVREALEGGFDR